MDNRFGIKDFFLFLLLAAVIVVVWLAMIQYDRQWKLVQQISNQLEEQTRELAWLQRTLQQGVRLSGAAASTQAASASGEFGDPFKYVEAAKQNKDYAQGDWLIDNFGTKLARLTPLVDSDIYEMAVQARVQESLVYRDPMTLDYLPLLATSWQKSPDGMTFTFQLRQGVTFSDGEPFTADDVVFTYEFTMNPKVAAPRDRAYLEKVGSVEKKGPYEVVFKLKEPYYESFDLCGGLQIMPKHYYEKVTPEQFNESTGMLMGTGPYMLKGAGTWRPGMSGEFWRPGDTVELVRNERYWGEPGPFDKLVWHQIEQESAEMTMFKNGDIDLFAAQPDEYTALLKDKQVTDRTWHFEYPSPTLGYFFVAWNEQLRGKSTWFADKRVRQALTMLIDRQRLVDEVLLGYGTVSTGPFYQQGKQVDPNVKAWPYDPARAKQLLKEAGFEDRNGDGLLDGPDGQPFRFKLTYGSSNKLLERIALALKDGLAKAGIAMELDPADWAIMLKKMESREFDAITLGWSGAIESDVYQEFDSKMIKDNGDNFMSYINPSFDKVVETARTTVDEAARMQLWHEAHRILHEDQPYTFLFDRKALVFGSNRIKNVERSKIGLNYAQRFVMPIPWYVPKALQKWK